MTRITEFKRGSDGYLWALEQVAEMQHSAIQKLLASHNCIAPNGTAEIIPEISAQFDMIIEDARFVVETFDNYRRANAGAMTAP